MTSVVLRRAATLDIRAAARWYDEQDLGLGSIFSAQIKTTIQRIAVLPTRFPIVESPLRRALVHQFPYAVYFVVEPSRVVVLGVFHQHRNPTAWRARIEKPSSG